MPSHVIIVGTVVFRMVRRVWMPVRGKAELDKVWQQRRKKLRKQQQQQQLPGGGSDDVTIAITVKPSLLATVKMDVMCDAVMGKIFRKRYPCF